MLVLARKVGQHIVIGDCIEITVLNIRGDQVRLGITAPRDVVVHRKEVLMQVPPNAAKADAGTRDTAHPKGVLRPGPTPGKPD